MTRNNKTVSAAALAANGYRENELDEILARLACGESVDAAMQAIDMKVDLIDYEAEYAAFLKFYEDLEASKKSH